MQPGTGIVIVLLVGAISACGHAAPADAPGVPANVQRPSPSEKDSRTPAQQKINSQLLYEIYRLRGQAKEKRVPPDPTGVKIDRTGRALVDVRADVSPALESKVKALGGTIRSTSREYRSIIAWIPLQKLERLAEDPTVRAIEPAAEAAIK